jgi:hypothetical protein
MRLGKRIVELTAMFTAAVGGELTPMRRLAIDAPMSATYKTVQTRVDRAMTRSTSIIRVPITAVYY